jgi:3-oxoacyl-[acyl-carrier protein] reductase
VVLGSATARLFAGNGANVVVNYHRSSDRAETLVEELLERGVESTAIRVDVLNVDEVRSMIQKAVSSFENIDVLVNNAVQHPPPLFDFEKPDWGLWRRMMEVNILGVIICSHHCHPFLRESEGNIVNVVMDWDAGGIGYTLTKATGTPLTRGLARELAPVRVNVVSPGAVVTWG